MGDALEMTHFFYFFEFFFNFEIFNLASPCRVADLPLLYLNLTRNLPCKVFFHSFFKLIAFCDAAGLDVPSVAVEHALEVTMSSSYTSPLSRPSCVQ